MSSYRIIAVFGNEEFGCRPRLQYSNGCSHESELTGDDMISDSKKPQSGRQKVEQDQCGERGL